MSQVVYEGESLVKILSLSLQERSSNLPPPRKVVPSVKIVKKKKAVTTSNDGSSDKSSQTSKEAKSNPQVMTIMMFHIMVASIVYQGRNILSKERYDGKCF